MKNVKHSPESSIFGTESLAESRRQNERKVTSIQCGDGGRANFFPLHQFVQCRAATPTLPSPHLTRTSFSLLNITRETSDTRNDGAHARIHSKGSDRNETLRDNPPLVPLVPPSPQEQEFVQIGMGMRKHAAFSRMTLFSGNRSAWTASRRDDAGVAKPPEDLI